jgi:hypothetical protein
MRPPSPYQEPGFYDRALAEGRHRAIVGGRWEETGRLQMQALIAAGLRREDRLLDIGAGALRLGVRAVPWLNPGNYWATDACGALMRRGWEEELPPAAQARLPPAQLVEDADFALPGVPADIDMAICFAVLTHLPPPALPQLLAGVRGRLPGLRGLLLSVFLAPAGAGAWRQPDGVVTHPDRAPWHMAEIRLLAEAEAAGFSAGRESLLLPRGQVLFVLRPGPGGRER